MTFAIPRVPGHLRPHKIPQIPLQTAIAKVHHMLPQGVNGLTSRVKESTGLQPVIPIYGTAGQVDIPQETLLFLHLDLGDIVVQARISGVRTEKGLFRQSRHIHLTRKSIHTVNRHQLVIIITNSEETNIVHQQEEQAQIRGQLIPVKTRDIVVQKTHRSKSKTETSFDLSSVRLGTRKRLPLLRRYTETIQLVNQVLEEVVEAQMKKDLFSIVPNMPNVDNSYLGRLYIRLRRGVIRTSKSHMTSLSRSRKVGKRNLDRKKMGIIRGSSSALRWVVRETLLQCMNFQIIILLSPLFH